MTNREDCTAALPRRFHIVTLGCQMNKYDSDHLAQLLVRENFLPVQTPEEADLILINTCSVRAKAEQKAFSLLGRMVRLKQRRGGGLTLGLMGCIAQQEGAALMKRFPALDLVLGTRAIAQLPSLLRRVEEQGERVAATDLDAVPPPPPALAGYFAGRVTGFVSVMEGCNNFCSYCIVPFVRGREISRSPEEIEQEVRHLVAQGVREVTLLGQNVNSYRWGDAAGGAGFARLLDRVCRTPGLLRVRFTTSHPKDLSEELIRCFADLERLCPHIHLPVQAGSNRILRRMNRKYTREQYADLVGRIRRTRPGIAITSDVIVGFPGETERDFERTLDLLREIEFDALFSFKYSDRKDTLAAKMDAKIDEEEKAARLTTLQGLQRRITLRKNKEMEGETAVILVEGGSKRGGQCTGRTGTNKIVNFDFKISDIGHLVNVKIKRAHVNSLWGETTGEALPASPEKR